MDSGGEGAVFIYPRIVTSGGPLRTLYETFRLHNSRIVLDLLSGFGVARRTPV
jgi:hypothetical protein